MGWGYIKVGRDKKNFSFSQSLTSTLKFSFYCIFGLPPPPHTNSLRCWQWRFFFLRLNIQCELLYNDGISDHIRWYIQFKRKKQIEQQRKFRKNFIFIFFIPKKKEKSQHIRQDTGNTKFLSPTAERVEKKCLNVGITCLDHFERVEPSTCIVESILYIFQYSFQFFVSCQFQDEISSLPQAMAERL